MFLHNGRFFSLPISTNYSLVGLDNSSVVGLETTLDILSFSVETRIDSNPIKEVDEYFHSDYNSVNELFFILMVSVPNKVEYESVGGFFLE